MRHEYNFFGFLGKCNFIQEKFLTTYIHACIMYNVYIMMYGYFDVDNKFIDATIEMNICGTPRKKLSFFLMLVTMYS